MSLKNGDFADFDTNFGEARLPVAASMSAWFDGYLNISDYSRKFTRIYCDAWTY